MKVMKFIIVLILFENRGLVAWQRVAFCIAWESTLPLCNTCWTVVKQFFENRFYPLLLFAWIHCLRTRDHEIVFSNLVFCALIPTSLCPSTANKLKQKKLTNLVFCAWDHSLVFLRFCLNKLKTNRVWWNGPKRLKHWELALAIHCAWVLSKYLNQIFFNT